MSALRLNKLGRAVHLSGSNKLGRGQRKFEYLAIVILSVPPQIFR